MRHIYKQEIRWADIDWFGHVNNATYLTYVQEARVDFHWYAPKARGEKALLMDMVVARTEVDYIEPLKEPHIFVDVAVWVSRIGNSSFTLSYEISYEGKLYSRASSVQVAVSMENERSRPLSDEERAFLNKYLELPK